MASGAGGASVGELGGSGVSYLSAYLAAAMIVHCQDQGVATEGLYCSFECTARCA